MKYKLKTKSSAKKRLKVTASGLVMIKKSCRQHNLRKTENDRVQGWMKISPNDRKVFKKYNLCLKQKKKMQFVNFEEFNLENFSNTENAANQAEMQGKE